MPITIAVSPNGDHASRVVATWLADFESDLASKIPSFPLQTITGLQVSREMVEDHVGSGSDVDLIAYFGHGSAWALRARDENILDLHNYGMCFGRAVYAVACWSRRILGKAVVMHGGVGTAYFGYNNRLFIPPSDECAHFIKAAVNGGLKVLHNRDKRPNRNTRYRAAAYQTRLALLKAVRESRKRGYFYESLLIQIWKLGFDADWVTD